MRKIYVAVGTSRRPKLNAVWEALTIVGPLIDSDAKFEVIEMQAETGVGHTPLTRAEIMQGAYNRVQHMRTHCAETQRPPDFYVGLEGGLDVIEQNGRRMVFLESWAYVHGDSRWLDPPERYASQPSFRGSAFGQSGAILVPEALARRVVDDGVEMAEAIDAFAGEQAVRDQQGAWGVFTRNLITRQDSFRTAVINAFAPFFNCELYNRSERSS
jgi:non-canonical (house-cleaning) NTP pyrophosphatase